MLIPFLSCAQGQGQSDKDPLVQIDYREAFNFSKIQKKYRPLMERLGCAANVFDEENDYHQVLQNENYEQVENNDQNNFQHQQELKNYQAECIAHLKSERRSIILKPAKEAALTLGCIGTAMGGLALCLGTDSYGGSFGIFAALMNLAYLGQDVLKSGYHLCKTPPHAVDDLEIEFAKKQCFIPKKIWPSIIIKFIVARTNPFDQNTAVSFIKFALGLTVFKAKNKIVSEYTEEKICHIIVGRINQFFKQYESLSKEEIGLIKANVCKFIEQLFSNDDDSPRYLHLQGPGGIGKTHFAGALVNWINELLPNCVNFDELKITSPDQLEGSEKKQGAFLEVLSHQCQSGNPASIVFMDEVTWLNKEDYIPASKRVFNGDQSRLSTTFFGTDANGSGLKFNIPHMLIIIASNEEIKDPALKSRFDSIGFPMPKEETFLKHAQYLLENSKFVKKYPNYYNQESDRINTELINGIQDLNNFRAIKSRVERLLADWKEEAREEIYGKEEAWEEMDW